MSTFLTFWPFFIFLYLNSPFLKKIQNIFIKLSKVILKSSVTFKLLIQSSSVFIILETSECQIKNRLNSIIWRHTDVHIMSIGRPKIPCFERCENLGRSDLKSMWTLKLYYFCTIFIVYHTSLDKFNKWWKCYKCKFKKLREGTPDGVLDPLSFFVILTIFHVIKKSL